MKFIISFLIIMSMVTLVLAQETPVAPKPDGPLAYKVNMFSAKVLSVLNPGEYLVQKTGEKSKFYVKLQGVKVPKQTEPGGQAAMKYVTNLVQGQTVAIDAIKQDHKVVIAKVYYKNQDLGTLINKQGFGKAKAKPKTKRGIRVLPNIK